MTQQHRRSIRLKGWDYRTAGYYFITICTYRRQCLFDDERLRTTAANAWAYIPYQPGSRHVTLDEWVVMPNHLHGLICLAEQDLTPPQRELPAGPTPEPSAGDA